jgi:hypothetical protein
MNQVKARLKVGSVTQFDTGNKEVKMQAATGKGNEDFTKYTPLANFAMQITSEAAAADFFEPGATYDVFFVKSSN